MPSSSQPGKGKLGIDDEEDDGEQGQAWHKYVKLQEILTKTEDESRAVCACFPRSCGSEQMCLFACVGLWFRSVHVVCCAGATFRNALTCCPVYFVP